MGQVIEENELRYLCSFAGTCFTDKNEDLCAVEHIKEFLSVESQLLNLRINSKLLTSVCELEDLFSSSKY